LPMNLPNSIVRHVLSAVALVFGSVIEVPKCFPDNCDILKSMLIFGRAGG
jgi:hypothetical protein